MIVHPNILPYHYLSASPPYLYAASVRGEMVSVDRLPLPPDPITATFGTVLYNTVDRSLVSDITFSAVPQVFNVSAFIVELQSGNTWIQQTSGWTITASNGTTTRTITATPDNSVSSGTYRITLKANALITNQPSADANTTGVLIGVSPSPTTPTPTPPTVTWSNISGGRSLSANLNFVSSSVSNIDSTDFEVLDSNNVVQTGWTITPSSNTALNGGFVTVVATPSAATNGNFRLRVRANTIRSEGSTLNNTPASDQTSAAALVNTQVFTIANAIWATVAGGTSLTATIRFNGASISGIDAADFQVLNDSNVVQSGWTILPGSASAIDGGSVLVIATPPAGTSGTFRLQLSSDSIRSGGSSSNNAPSANIITSSVVVNNTISAVVATAAWSNETGGKTISGRITFSGTSVIGIDASDFEVLNSSDVIQSGWILDITNSIVSSGGSITVTGTAPSDTNGSFKLRLKSLSVQSGGSSSNNAPANPVVGDAVTVNNIPVVANAAWSNISGGASLSGRITFSGASVIGIDSNDFEVLNASNQIQNGWAIISSGTGVLDGGFVTVNAFSSSKCYWKL